MNDVERVFRHLVEVISAREPALLQAPIEVADLYQNIIPYRAHRAALRFDTNQDYEMAVLRLLAGERGLVEMESGDVHERLVEELRAPNPNPGKFREYGGARVTLNFRAVQDVLAAHDAYAPPARAHVEPENRSRRHPQRHIPFEAGGDARLAAPGASRLEPDVEQPAPGSAIPAPSNCPHCDAGLPPGRPVVFCPFCGGKVHVRACPQCGTELETGWRHCITCGYRAGG
ncbi:MAG: zinc ribbon domain-containing protein [Gemmatimonadetes bacterium]|nr:zinc ribbon domain-containing protein [Gemmatimonadota bacterium]